MHVRVVHIPAAIHVTFEKCVGQTNPEETSIWPVKLLPVIARPLLSRGIA